MTDWEGLMNKSTPLFYENEIVLYYKKPCIVLNAAHYGRDYPEQAFRERYVIRYIDGKNKFRLTTKDDLGNEYIDTNRCAGEYLEKTSNKLLDTEKTFKELYEI